MPRQLLFEAHPEMRRMRGDTLGRPMIPSDVLYEHMAKHGEDWFEIMSRDPQSGVKDYAFKKRIKEKSLILWMTDVIDEFEGRLREEFSWTFQWHQACRWNDPDDDRENVFECGPPRWYVTIRDFESNIVHKNWVIAFSIDYGDFLTARGVSGQPIVFDWNKWYERSKKLMQITDAIREHQRIRNLRLKRLGIEVPGE